MKVYCLFESYHNFADSWKTLIDIYIDKEDVYYATHTLEQDSGSDRTSFYIIEMETK